MPSATPAGSLVAPTGPQPVIEHPISNPNDPGYTDGSQWGLNGPNGINAPAAWNITTGSPATVTVADIDTGIQYDHPDLYQNIWINQAEIPASRMKNLVDVYDDGYISWRDLNNPINIGPGKITDVNGDGVIDAGDILSPMIFNPDGTDSGLGGWANPNNVQDGDTAHPDDLIGWNFVDNTNDPLDDLGHGTETAGVIAATGNNGLGITGVDWSAQVMALKFIDSNGNGTDTEAAAAINYAVAHGARVINASWGAYGGSQVLASAISAAGQAGVVFVAGAGNDGNNTDTDPFYPAAFDLPGEISVAATDPNGDLSGSNYGPTTIDLAAPGQNIETTWSDGSYGTFSGTSAATAFVTGTVALVEGLHPGWSADQVVHQVMATVTPDTALSGQIVTGGIVNAAAAVGSVVPAIPTINWTNPADIAFGTSLSTTQLDATATAFGAPIAGQFTYSPSLGTVLNAGANQTLTVFFVPSDTTDYAPASASVLINVQKATPLLSWSNPADIVYGTALGSVQLDATATYGGNPVPGLFTYTPVLGTVLHAGPGQVLSASFAPTDTQDFNPATVTALINVQKATPTITWATPARITYGTALSPSQLDATASVAGTFVYSSPQGSVPGAGLQTLTVTLTPTDSVDYYTAVGSTLLSVAKAHLSILAGNNTIHYGDVVPALTFALSGFVNGDTAHVVGGSPTLSTAASSSSPVGSYPIVVGVGTLAAVNYDFPTLVNGTLTVSKAHLTVSADNKTKLRGASNPALTATITGFVNGDKASVVTGAPVLSTTATASSAIGVFPILIGIGTLSASNYDFTNLIGGNLSVIASTAALVGNFDGGKKTDLSVIRPSTDQWIIQYSGGGGETVQFGDPSQGDIPVPGNYEGTGKADLAVFRPSTDLWIIRLASGATQMIQFGDPAAGDVPVPGDYEGIGKTDLAVFRPSTDQWIIRLSTGATQILQFGDPSQHDMPVPGDYDGDGKTDLAVFRPASDLWIIRDSSTGATQILQFGDPSQHDMPVPGDYDGDGKTDLAVFRPASDLWIIRYSDPGNQITQFGDPATGDVATDAPLALLLKPKSPSIKASAVVSSSVALPPSSTSSTPLIAIAPQTSLDSPTLFKSRRTTSGQSS